MAKGSRPAGLPFGGRRVSVVSNNRSYVTLGGGSVKNALAKAISILNTKKGLDRTNIAGLVSDDERFNTDNVPVRILEYSFSGVNSETMSAKEAIRRYGGMRVDTVSSNQSDRSAYFSVTLETAATREQTQRAVRRRK